MAALDFPSSPTLNQVYTAASGACWTWDGISWRSANASVFTVTGTAPVSSTGGLTPNISMAAATDSVPGYMTAADHTLLSGKAPLASPTFTGTVTAGTTSMGALTATRIATVTGVATNWNTASSLDLTDTVGAANSRNWRISNAGSPDYGYLNFVVAVNNSTSIDTSRTTVLTLGSASASFNGLPVSMGALTASGTMQQSGGYAYLGNYNASGIYPRGGTDVAIGWNNTGGLRDITFWNTDTGNTHDAFRFRQLTASGASDVAGAVSMGAVTATTVTTASLVGKTITIKDGIITGFA